jgi:probable rRNA maturation factor
MTFKNGGKSMENDQIYSSEYLKCSFYSGLDNDFGELNDWITSTVEVCSYFLFMKFEDYFKGETNSFNLSFEIVDGNRIKEINSEHRNKNSVTDVLSFPSYENLRSQNEDLLSMDGLCELGDLMICDEVTLKQSQEFSITYAQELAHLFIHGFLHLCGFDHEVDEYEEELMQAHEKFLITKLYQKKGLIK